jgi:hypothetical protein
VSDDLDRLLAALNAPPSRRPTTTETAPHRGRGRPPSLSPAEVQLLRRQRSKPLAERPRLVDLAALFRVDVTTVRKALQARPPYDFGEPVEPGVGGPHRDRGTARF